MASKSKTDTEPSESEVVKSTLPKISFYGKNRVRNAAVCAKLTRMEKEIKQRPIPLSYHAGITGASDKWKVFYKQEDAFQFARCTEEDLHVFSSESEMFDGPGQRIYIVGSYQHFWHIYSQLLPKQRTHYEIIPEGAVCRLYFDLEFYTSHNQDKDGVEMCANMIKMICSQLFQHYDIKCSATNILQLDASTDTKFSRHLIFHIPGAVFANNIYAGNFVHNLCSLIWRCHNIDKNPVASSSSTETVATNHIAGSSSETENCPEGRKRKLPPENGERDEDIMDTIRKAGLQLQQIQNLVVKDKNDKDVLFCDTGVYTKNRNFRLHLSSKKSKVNPLVIASDNQYKSHAPFGVKRSKDEQLFLDSLVCSVDYTTNLRILTSSAPDNKYSCKRATASPRISDPSEMLEGFKYSPYPEVDQFIQKVIKKGGVEGQIRRWTYFSQGELLVYEISKNRWCENIGRPHTSNNIMMLADIKRGVYYQKCHDPQCQAENFKSQELPLPIETLPWKMFGSEEDIEDDDLIVAANEAEFGQDFNDDELLAALDSAEQTDAAV